MGPDSETVPYIEVPGCLCPDEHTASKVIRVDEDLLRELRATNAYKYRNSLTAIDTVRAPERIYRGVRKNQFSAAWGWCYVSRPEWVRDAVGQPLPAVPGMVFVAYVGDSGILYEWGEEKADPNDHLAPERPEERFVEVAWSKKT